MDHKEVIDRTRRWISSVVIGLNLCPFAERIFRSDAIRYVVSDAQDESALLSDLEGELEYLKTAPISRAATTLLIHPQVFSDFLDYNDFLGEAEQLVVDLDLEGVIQIASFHPHYQFADAEPDAVENYTNRSPYPMLHLLREESITEVAGEGNDLLEIPRRNVETLKSLGREKILAKLREVADAEKQAE
jgi:hypothetical protein